MCFCLQALGAAAQHLELTEARLAREQLLLQNLDRAPTASCAVTDHSQADVDEQYSSSSSNDSAQAASRLLLHDLDPVLPCKTKTTKTTKLPCKTKTTKLPRRAKTTKLPRKAKTTKLPRKAKTTKLPKKTMHGMYGGTLILLPAICHQRKHKSCTVYSHDA